MNDNKPSLIYLDDEEINLILFKEMFKKDFDIFTTTNPDKAIEHVKKNFLITRHLLDYIKLIKQHLKV